MSERSKGDTSSSVSDAPPTSTRVVNNPLLSASVTGLTFDDFQNKPLLLPAAPPVIHPVAPVVTSRESTPLVTVGKLADIDSENLSEVNLNDTSGAQSNSGDNSDENSNSLLEPTNTQTDSSILSQAASSFSQLPSVASTVFSTFSKKFNSSSSRDDLNSNLTSQLDIQSFTTPYHHGSQNLQPLGIPEQKPIDESSNEPQQPPPPPAFFCPTDIPSAPSAVPCPPASSTGQNTYRITARKKAYAPIPGLSSSHPEQAPPSVLASFPPPTEFETTPDLHYLDQPANKQDDRKGGLFSLSNLVPAVPNVLQNLSGLVQSATGNLTQRQAEPVQVSAIGEHSIPFGHWQNPNSFVPQPTANPASQPINFFAQNNLRQPQTIDSITHTQIQPENYFTPLAAAQSEPPCSPPAQPLADQGQVKILNPSTNLPSEGGHSTNQTQSLSQTDQQPGIANFFAPIPASTERIGQTPPPPLVQRAIQPPAEPIKTVSSVPPVSSLFPSSIPSKFPLQEPPAEGEVNLFAPSETPQSHRATPISQPPNAARTPPLVGQVPTSFRLQKGTRLYKNPFGSSSEHSPQQLAYSPAQEPSLPPNQGNFNIFNPLQSSFLPPQQSPVPFVPEKEPSTKFSSSPLHTSTANIAAPKSEENSFTQPPIPPCQVEVERKISDNQVLQSSTIEPSHIPDKGLHDPAKTLNLPKSSPQEQPTSLPPHPTITPESAAVSKETANFPPPPPQHTFPNRPSSNPYRKGLLPQHSQPIAPAPISTIFTPNEQGTNLFQPIATEPPSITSFFGQNSATISQVKDATINPVSIAATILPTETKSLSSAIFSPTIPTATDPTSSVQFFKDPLPVRPIPVPASNAINFFHQEPPPADKPTSTDTSVTEDQSEPKPNVTDTSVPVASDKIATPLDTKENPKEQQSVPNLFSNFFGQSSQVAGTTVVNQPPLLPDPTSFFDSFGPIPSVGVDAPPPEDPNSQRIQNFFNNPPPKDFDPVGDLNYNLVGSGLSVRNLQPRSLTPASNLAEPPSSSCSDFSELNSSLSAANRQPRASAEDSTKVSPEEEAIFEAPDNLDLPEEIINELKMSNNASEPTVMVYKPAVKHWFFKKKLDTKQVWTPFSLIDSALLEQAFLSGDENKNVVAVEGGRYDVNISDRTKVPVYWEGEPIEVRRCSWFYKASDSKYIPYEEAVADILEEEYKKASETGEWHKKIPISATDLVVFHGPTVIVHFQQHQQVDSWGGSTQTSSRPRVVKRDIEDFTIEEGESHKVDHLLFMVHGIGSACDLKLRSVEEVVDEFRSIALQLVQSHYKNSVENGSVGRVEVLPVSWHDQLHSDELGIDEKLKSITLESIPKLRNFTNDTLLDILFYTSPMFCQRIMNTVTASMNSIYIKYKQRNPDFQGGTSLAGHSLGSLILFDLLCHQKPLKECEEQNLENPDCISSDFLVDSNRSKVDAEQHISYKMGPAGTGQPFISYPQLLFQPKKFFALGSPIGMFVTIRGIDKLGLDFRLPTCPGFYNIFHPYDPVAYRLEALVNPDMSGIPPVLIPHHKGRKRMHLELKETMSRVGADLKQRFFETFKTTFDSVGFLSSRSKNDPKEIEKEVEKVLELQAQQEQGPSAPRPRADSNSTNQSDGDAIEIDFPLGKLNDARRVDYVLQEAPLEFFNEYLFALSSHVCYWESEDTILFVMKEIYSGIGISPDSQVPQQTMTIERPSSRASEPHSHSS